MFMLFGWGKNVGKSDLKFVVSNFNVSLVSSGELGNCLPGTISIDIVIPPDQKAKPAAELFKFAKNQHDTTKTDGGGKIIIYEGREVGQPIQEVTFDKAWINDISSGASAGDQEFQMHLTVTAASIMISDVKFEDQRRVALVGK